MESASILSSEAPSSPSMQNSPVSIAPNIQPPILNVLDDERVVDEYGFLVAPDKRSLPSTQEKKFTNAQKETNILGFLSLSNEEWKVYRLSHKSLIKKLCRAGIPESLRSKAWSRFANVEDIFEEGLYDKLSESKEHRPIFDVIERDINRCYPDHVMFKDPQGDGQKNLFKILKAYALYNPTVEYCQGMHFLVGMMMMHCIPEECFWLLSSTIKNYCPEFFSPGLTQIQIDVQFFDALFKKKFEKLHKKMTQLDVEPIIYLTPWFLTFFTQSLPWECCLRVWDIFYFDGVKALFRFSLGILKSCEKHILGLQNNNDLMSFILHIPKDVYLTSERLIRLSIKIPLSSSEVVKGRIKVVSKQMQELS